MGVIWFSAASPRRIPSSSSKSVMASRLPPSPERMSTPFASSSPGGRLPLSTSERIVWICCSYSGPRSSPSNIATRACIVAPFVWPRAAYASTVGFREALSLRQNCEPSRAAVICGPAADADVHELGRAQGSNADKTHQPPLVEIALRHRAAVALDVERLSRRLARQRASPELAQEEVRDRGANRRPQRFGVRLEDGPLCPTVDRVLEVGEVPADVHVLPLGIGRGRPRSPDANLAAAKDAKTVDPVHVQRFRVRFAHNRLELDPAVHGLVRRRLLHAATEVVAGVDARDETAGRNVDLLCT